MDEKGETQENVERFITVKWPWALFYHLLGQKKRKQQKRVGDRENLRKNSEWAFLT